MPESRSRGVISQVTDCKSLHENSQSLPRKRIVRRLLLLNGWANFCCCINNQSFARQPNPSIRFAKDCILKGWLSVEAGSNTSTVTLRVVGGDEKGSLKSETVKYGRESQGTGTREWLRWRGPGEIVNDRPVLSSERALHINKLATVWQ
jgi:hypothetical protein